METIQNKRIGYIDALRGFTMLLVVFSHIQYFGYGDFVSHQVSMGGGNVLIYRDLITIVFMPLFFFISGFVLYKPHIDWTLTYSLRFMANKALSLLIPTIVFISLYIFIFNPPLSLLLQSGRLGYWFTIALFEYYAFYAIFRFLCRILQRKDGIDWILLLGSVLLYFFVTQSVLRRIGVSDDLSNMLGLDQLRFFCYFALGILVKKYFSTIEKILLNGKVSAFYIVLFLLIFLYVHQDGYSFPNAMFYHLYQFVGGILSTLIVFICFDKYQEKFSEAGKIGDTLQYIGRHTLAIYMLHYFFIPRNLQFIGEFFIVHPNPSIELVVTAVIAILVTGMSLLCNSVICTSPFLAHWLFGVKYATQTRA